VGLFYGLLLLGDLLLGLDDSCVDEGPNNEEGGACGYDDCGDEVSEPHKQAISTTALITFSSFRYSKLICNDRRYTD